MVSSISSPSGEYDAAQIQRLRSKAADRMLKTVDANQDGKITESELSTVLDGQSSKVSATTDQLFKQLDQGNKGYITKQDLEDGLAKADQTGSGQKTQSTTKGAGPGGPPPAGGGGSKSAAASGSAAATTAYDPEDLNQDGTVTMQEAQQYAANLYQAQAQSQVQSPASRATSVYV